MTKETEQQTEKIMKCKKYLENKGYSVNQIETKKQKKIRVNKSIRELKQRGVIG